MPNSFDPGDFEDGYRNVPAEDLAAPLNKNEARELLLFWYRSKAHSLALNFYVREGVQQYMGQFAINCRNNNPENYDSLCRKVESVLYEKIYNYSRKIKLVDSHGVRFSLKSWIRMNAKSVTEKLPNSDFFETCRNFLTPWNIERRKHERWRNTLKKIVAELGDNRRAVLESVAAKLTAGIYGSAANPRRRATPIVYACMDLLMFIYNEGGRPQIRTIEEKFSLTTDEAHELWEVMMDFLTLQQEAENRRKRAAGQ